MSLSDTDADNMLGVRFGGLASDVPTSYDVALSSTPFLDDGTGATEPTDTAYARATVVNNATTWAAPSGRSVSSAIDVTFPTATADWENVQYWALYDHASPNRLCAWGRFAAAVTVPTGSPGTITAGSLTIRVPASTITL